MPLTVDFEALSYISSLVEAFQAFDSDNDGLVTAPELRGLLASLGLDKSEAEARDMLARADGDRDGRLSVEDLLDVMNAGELARSATCCSRRCPRSRATGARWSARTSSPGRSASWAPPAPRTARPSSSAWTAMAPSPLRSSEAHGRAALDRTYAATPTLGNWNGF